VMVSVTETLATSEPEVPVSNGTYVPATVLAGTATDTTKFGLVPLIVTVGPVGKPETLHTMSLANPPEGVTRTENEAVDPRAVESADGETLRPNPPTVPPVMVSVVEYVWLMAGAKPTILMTYTPGTTLLAAVKSTVELPKVGFGTKFAETPAGSPLTPREIVGVEVPTIRNPISALARPPTARLTAGGTSRASPPRFAH
jgi:hypothetical protein